MNKEENLAKFNEIDKVNTLLSGIKTIDRNTKCEVSKIVEIVKVVNLTDLAAATAAYTGTNLYEKSYRCPTAEQLAELTKTYGEEYKNSVKEEHGTIKYKVYVKK